MKNRIDQRRVRHMRLRQKIRGTAARPRMSIHMSNCNLTVQFVDDDAATTLASVTTVGTDSKLNVATAAEYGKKAAEVALEKGIKSVVVDRGGFAFHGRVKACVEAAVEAGLQISDKAKAEEEAK